MYMPHYKCLQERYMSSLKNAKATIQKLFQQERYMSTHQKYVSARKVRHQKEMSVRKVHALAKNVCKKGTCTFYKKRMPPKKKADAHYPKKACLQEMCISLKKTTHTHIYIYIYIYISKILTYLPNPQKCLQER